MNLMTAALGGCFFALIVNTCVCQYQLRRLRRDINRLIESEPERGVPLRTTREQVSESIDAHEARFHRR